MRNLSMKKFGTPMRAGPGCASVKPGLAGAGLPSAWVTGAGATTAVVRSFGAAALRAAAVRRAPALRRSAARSLLTRFESHREAEVEALRLAGAWPAGKASA